MTNPDYNILTYEVAQAVLDEIFLGSQLIAIYPAHGSYSNFTHLVTARASDRSEFRIVIRRYQAFGNFDRGQKARREFAALQCTCQNDIPSPQPLYLDETGALLGIPGIVTRYVSGEQIESPADPIDWARALAHILARIHKIPLDSAPRSLLLDANHEATWFIQADSIPDFMQAYPDGARVWQMVKKGILRLDSVPLTLVHVDFWPGNILWEDGQVSAVVDWEEAALGDPAIDVAYCRMDMALRGMPQAAEAFLQAYESAVGHPLANLGFWELAAAARPMFSPEGWVDQSPAKERFADFITVALLKIS